MFTHRYGLFSWQVAAFIQFSFSQLVNASFQTAYETQTVQGLNACPSGARCCTDSDGVAQIRRLFRNASIYAVFEVADTNLTASLLVQGNESASGDQWRSSLDFEGQELFASDLVLVCHDNGTTCFFVPKSLISNKTLGITDQYYSEIPNLCELPLGFVLSPDPLIFDGGPSQWDQLLAFRSKKLPGVGFFGNESALVQLNASNGIYRSGNISTFFSQEIVAAQFSQLFSEATVLLSNETDLGEGRVSIVLANFGVATEEIFRVAFSKCSFTVASVLPDLQQEATVAKNASVEFIFTIEATEAGNGTCEFLIYSRGIEQDLITVALVPLWQNETGESRSLRMQTCTVDQQAPNCAPRDCFQAYSGEKNFYNPQNGLCEPVTMCPEEAPLLNLENNTCAAPSQPEIYPPINVPESLEVLYDGFCSSESGQPIPDYCNNTQFTVTGEGGLGENQTFDGAMPPLTSGVSSVIWIAIIIAAIIASILACCLASCICKARRRKAERQLSEHGHERFHQSLQQSYVEKQDAIIPTVKQGSLEYEFNLGSGALKPPPGLISEIDLLRCCSTGQTVFFRANTTLIPGVVEKRGRGALSQGGLQFRTDPSHIYASSMPLTPLTLQQAQAFITTENGNLVR